jgi:hypothetical protein
VVELRTTNLPSTSRNFVKSKLLAGVLELEEKDS